jgi:PAS domain S-box-containing protein
MPEQKDIWQIERFSEKMADLERALDQPGRPMVDTARQALAELGVALEELQVAEEELRSQNEELLGARSGLEIERGRYRALFEFAPDGYLVTTLQGRILEANRAAAELLNVANELLMGKILTVFVTLDDRPRFRQQLNQLPIVDRMYDWEVLLKPHHGRPVDISISTATERDEWGRPAALRWLLRDISTRKRMEAERDAAQTALVQRLGQVEVLHSIDQAILAARSPGEIAGQTAAQLRTLAQCSRVTVVTFDHEHGEAEHVAVDTDRPTVLTRGQHRPLTDYRLTDRAKSLESLSVVDITQTANLPEVCRALAEEGLRAFLSVPLWADGRLIGALTLADEKAGVFAEGLVAFAHQVADSLAVALHNSRLTEQLQANHRELQDLSRRLVTLQEAERSAIARELHDEVGQALVSLMLGLRAVRNSGPGDEQFNSRIDDAQAIADQVLTGLHQLAVNLRPASLDRLGLVPALRQYITEFQERTGLAAQFVTVGLDDQRTAPDVGTAFYRVVQEALTNIARHAQAHQVGVVLERRDDSLVAIVEDDGIGFDVQAALAAGRLGLVGMRERVEALGGQLTLDSAPERGTTVFMEVPFDRAYPHR